MRLQSTKMTSFRVGRLDRHDHHASSREACFGATLITFGIWTHPGNHAEVCFGATLHHFWLMLVITATCQSLFWNNSPSLWAHFGDRARAWAWAQDGEGEQSTCPSSQHSTCLASQQSRCLGSRPMPSTSPRAGLLGPGLITKINKKRGGVLFQNRRWQVAAITKMQQK